MQKKIEDKAKRIGNSGVEIESMKAGLADTQKGMREDRKILEDMYEQCAKKETEWDTECKARAEDLLAHADTFKILDDDGALELAKETFPSPAFLLQTEVSFEQIQQQDD